MAVNIEFGNISPFDCKGNPTSVGPRWRRWKRSFEFFLEAKGVKKDSQRKALLLHCAGQDVQDIFDTLTDPGPDPEHDSEYAKAMRSLDAHFAHQVNIPFERHQFRQAKQEESETADQFVLRLFQLSENCDLEKPKRKISVINRSTNAGHTTFARNCWKQAERLHSKRRERLQDQRKRLKVKQD